MDSSQMCNTAKYNYHDEFSTVFKDDQKLKYVLLILTVVLLLVYALRNRSKRKLTGLEKIPWLPSLPLIGPCYHIFQNRNDLAKLQETWVNKYPIARTKILGKNIVLLNSPALLKTLHASSDHGHLLKPEKMYSKLFSGLVLNGLLISKPAKWEPHRKLLHQSFTYEKLKSYIPVIVKHGNKLAIKLDSNNDLSVLYDSCLEVIIEIVLGVSIDDLDVALRSDILEKFHKGVMRYKEVITQMNNEPWLLLDLVWNFHSCKRDLKSSMKGMENACRKILEYRISHTNNQRKCVMDVLINENCSEDEILSEALTFIIGGHETVGVTIMFLLLILANEKQHQSACQKEVDQLFDKLDSADEEISMRSINELKYLERCIKETLRMFPSAPNNWRELNTPLKLDDKITLYPGTIIAICIWGIHRNPVNYSNPEKFDPDRFLAENKHLLITHSYLPFSAGPRNCIGWKMAMMEMTIISAIILRQFDISTTDKLEDFKVNLSFTLWTEKEPTIKFSRRTAASRAKMMI